MKRGGVNRTERIADLIQKALADIFLRELNDAAFRFVTITGVNVARDLAYAKVFVSLPDDNAETIKLLLTELNRNTKAFRYALAHAVKLRIVPELKFVYDDTTARAFKIKQLIDSTTNKE